VEDSEVEEEEEAVVVEGMPVFSIKKDNALSAITVDSHMRVLELVGVAVSEEVQVTMHLKDVEDRSSGPMAGSKEVEADTASQWE